MLSGYFKGLAMPKSAASHPIRALLFGGMACLFANAVPAQHAGFGASGAPSAQVLSTRAAVAAMGRTWNAQVLAETARLYTALQRQRPTAGIGQMKDLSYGPKAQQKLDLYFPDQGFEQLGPVFVFLHGGADTGGDKVLSGTDALVYSNVARLAARVGGVGINANYRLMKDSKWPAGAQDVRALIEWTRGHVAEHGGDPASIIVFANGEGAMHLATYLFDEKSQPADGPGIAGAILASGTLIPDMRSKVVRRYFGKAARLPLNLVDSYAGRAVPLMLWSADLDPVESGINELKDKLCRKPATCPTYVRLEGHNHVSHVMSMDSDDMSAMMSLPRFYHSAVRK
jgi:triacylglycerol lipase